MNTYYSKMNFSDLTVKSRMVAEYMKRDANEFEIAGISAQKMTNYEALIDAFETVNAYLIETSDQMVATQTKNDKRDELTGEMRVVLSYLTSVFHDDTARLKAIDVEALDRMSDNQLLATGTIIKVTLQKQKDELLADGYTPENIDAFAQLIDEFAQAIYTQKLAKSKRKTATQKRHQLANVLHSIMINYAAIGKAIWLKTGSVKAEDYYLDTGTKPKTSKDEEDNNKNNGEDTPTFDIDSENDSYAA